MKTVTTENAVDAALIAGTTLRLTRLVTDDDIGDRYIRRPVEAWALTDAHRAPEEHYLDGTRKETFPEFLAKGLSCPFCWGFWAGVGVLSSYALARRRPSTLKAWRAVATSLSLNYATANINARID